MREARTLVSWVLALFLGVTLAWVAADTVAPQPPTRNHLFELFSQSSGIAYFEPLGRLVVGALEVVAALLILIPATRRAGAVLSSAVLLGLSALIVQLVIQGIPVPVDGIGQDGHVTTTQTDPSGLFYLVLGLLVAAVSLIVIHPGRREGAD